MSRLTDSRVNINNNSQYYKTPMKWLIQEIKEKVSFKFSFGKKRKTAQKIIFKLKWMHRKYY